MRLTSSEGLNLMARMRSNGSLLSSKSSKARLSMLIDLGGGTAPHPRASVVIDLHHPVASDSQDAGTTPWTCFHAGAVASRNAPMNSGVFTEVYASHFMEHIPRGQPLINVMNEAWRVLKPGGTFTMILPLVGYTDPATGQPMSDHIGWQPWSDPTHVNYWWFPEALMYFCEGPFKPLADYGISIWAPMGPYIDDHKASMFLNFQRSNEVALGVESWSSVREGWEGVARLVKPT